MDTDKLKNEIIDVLEMQGFKINPHIRPASNTKSVYRELQQQSRNEQISLHRKFLKSNLNVIQKFTLNKGSFDPSAIDLELREVKRHSTEETLFKWWNFIWWSIPYQRAYGRQMRFLIWDKRHNVPFGLIGLQSPILKISVRNHYLGIPNSELDLWINKSMQAQRLGALPPYNQLIGGKMATLAMTSNELIAYYRQKYDGRVTEMEQRVIEPDLLFLTTTSAFGRSSIYNRLKFRGEAVALSLGYTKGSGSFHIPEVLYKKIRLYLSEEGIDTSTTFGHGPSRKVKLLYTAFRKLNIPGLHVPQLKTGIFSVSTGRQSS